MLNVNDIANINIPIIINELLLLSIRSKNAKSGITFEFKEYDIRPEYPIQKTIKKIIIDE